MSTNYEASCQGRMWGVFTADGRPHEMPMALFRSEVAAGIWRHNNHRNGSTVLRCDLYISYHNGPPGTDPKAEFKHFEP